MLKFDKGEFVYKDVELLDSELVVGRGDYHVEISTRAPDGRKRDYEINSSENSFETLAIQKRLEAIEGQRIRLGLLSNGFSIATIETSQGDVMLEVTQLKSATVFTSTMLLIIAAVSFLSGVFLIWLRG